jgi:hypothetical protein
MVQKNISGPLHIRELDLLAHIYRMNAIKICGAEGYGRAPVRQETSSARTLTNGT